VVREYEHAANDPASPERTDLVFLMLDLDHFKVVNDHHGHDAGDRVLEQTADILRDVCRKSDFVVRWGGEEFLVVSRFVDRLGATTFAERIRTAIAQHPFDVGDGVRVPQTCSVGFASFPFVEEYPQEHGWQDVLNVADRMLYLAKEIGRDSWAGVCEAVGEPGDALARRIIDDLPGCMSRGEIRCQTSRAYDGAEAAGAEASEPEAADPEKDEP
jgi:diguanylate cyclase (GGDEF)-like protein